MVDYFKIHILDVGQGDSIILETGTAGGDEYFSLIDCKTYGANIVPAVEFLQKRNVSNLQAIFLSHHHLDHADGLPILADYLAEVKGGVNYFVCPNLPADAALRALIYNNSNGREFLPKLTEIFKATSKIMSMPDAKGNGKCMPISLMFEGNVSSSAGREDIHHGLKIIPLSPRPDNAREYLASATSANGATALNINELSHVLWVQTEFQSKAFLFMGDLEGKPWANVKNNIIKVKNNHTKEVSFIKIPHHGAKNQQMERNLLEIIKNDQSVVFSLSTPSLNKDRPHRQTITFLKGTFPNSKIYCTGLAQFCHQPEEEVTVPDGESELGQFDAFVGSSMRKGDVIFCMGDHTVEVDAHHIIVTNRYHRQCQYGIEINKTSYVS